MRTMIAGATFLLVGVGAAAVGAAFDTTGSNIALNGSDTILEVTKEVISMCPNAMADSITYNGGGSGVGSAAMAANTQQVAPMSRSLKNTEYCGISIDSDGNGTVDLPVQGTTQGLVVGVDGIAVMANTTQVCAGNGVAGTTPSSSSIAVTAGSGDGACPGCSSGSYPITGFLDVLRVIYGGFHNNGTFDCNSDVRHSLANNWPALFSHACASGTCTQLSHAWRRSDLSGTTDAFATLVGFGSRGIGTLSTVPSASQKVNPFCNAADATTGVVSFGGSSDFSDLDPIRRPCGANDTVCEADGTLGLVLPVFYPDNSTTTSADAYNTVACDPGAFDLENPGSAALACPGNQPTFLGKCFQPFHLQPDGVTENFQCVAKKSARAFGTPSGAFDGRVWNLAIKHVDTTKNPVRPAAYVQDANGRFMTSSFFRIHQALATNTGGPTCLNTDDTQQIGCLVNSDPCSIGYAGREADQQAGNQALLVNNIAPVDANILQLLQNPVPATVYPLSRRLHFASLVGFSALKGGESELAKCYGNNTITKTAMSDHNFVPMPSPGIQCVSYDVGASTTAAPFAGCTAAASANTNTLGLACPAASQAFITNAF